MAVGTDTAMWHAAMLAWILAVPLWPITKFVVVVAHEGGHAMAAVALLRAVRKITFTRDGQGGTLHEIPFWPLSIVIAAAGYAGPSLFGLFAAWLLLHTEPVMVLWASMAFLVLMLPTLRGLIGWLIVPALLVVLFQVTTKAREEHLMLAAYVWVWLLLIGAVQRMILHATRGDWTVKENDTTRLSELTLVPSAVWSFVLLAGTIGALVWGGSLLLRMPA
ncbi:M50 family metallopeptidase [Actinoplanes sp. RD1]|uniref:M50 family metallopeptidase n=1 Tax=Actinoplanes sp. RD1 TaxID=3064538 RepID=UPI0027419334|nr:M50 family metallopeptidase [Actinoplanes sp. RD1]